MNILGYHKDSVEKTKSSVAVRTTPLPFYETQTSRPCFVNTEGMQITTARLPFTAYWWDLLGCSQF